MVQTEDQFAYIHYALLEYIKSGDTEIEAHELRDYIRRKTEVDTVTGLFINGRYLVNQAKCWNLCKTYELNI